MSQKPEPTANKNLSHTTASIQQQKHLTTCCAGCVFAKVDLKNGLQCDCAIQDISNESFTLNNGYIHFDHKICQYKRGASQVFPYVREEVKLKYVAMAECKTAEEALQFYSEAYKQTIPPQEAICIFRNVEESVKFIKTASGDPGPPYRSIYLPAGESITTGVMPKFVSTNLIWIIPATAKEEPRLWETLDRKINDEGMRFQAVGTADNSKLIVSRQLYNMNPLPFEEFVKHLGEKYDYDTLSRDAGGNTGRSS